MSVCNVFAWVGMMAIVPISLSQAVTATPAPPTSAPATNIPPSAQPATSAEQLDLPTDVVEDSPVLQRWLEEIPDVQSEIRRDPSFRTRLRLGYAHADDHEDGFTVGIEDVFVGRTGFTVSGAYQETGEGDRTAYGADLRYYVRPLGSYLNVAPVIGYRHLEVDDQTRAGVNVGVRLLLSLSRTGAADVSFSQSWVAPGTDAEVGISTLSFGYAVTPDLRLSTDLQQQNSPDSKDSQVGIVLEWML
jgi:hypothetical protein